MGFISLFVFQFLTFAAAFHVKMMATVQIFQMPIHVCVKTAGLEQIVISVCEIVDIKGIRLIICYARGAFRLHKVSEKNTYILLSI